MTGSVSLVGAGPGDPELITLRGLRRLRSAQVVVYDRLIHPDLLTEIPATAERIFAGKAAGLVAMSQEDIGRVLVERARAGKHVVRLKGGDPFVFGRGGEEIETLTAAGIPWEVVPGITSAVAVPAAASIPLTHRGLSSHFTVVTGHEGPAKSCSDIDWAWLARTEGTLIVLMGLERLPEISDRLMAEGLGSDTPAAAIASGTLPAQLTVTASLADLPEEVAQSGMHSPAVIVIGEVARFPEVIASAGLAELAQAV
jgi:uroporphyrin-III C-methyltransferase